jgi:hypothetical protein
VTTLGFLTRQATERGCDEMEYLVVYNTVGFRDVFRTLVSVLHNLTKYSLSHHSSVLHVALIDMWQTTFVMN